MLVQYLIEELLRMFHSSSQFICKSEYSSAALIMAGASVVAYIIGEGLTDYANSGSNTEDEE